MVRLGCGPQDSGLSVSALLAAPATVLLHPTAWPAALAAALALTATAVALAISTDRKH